MLQVCPVLDSSVLKKVSLAALFLFLLSVSFAQDAPMKVSKADGKNAVTTKVPPEYPLAAKQMKIEGTVEVEALVNESGTVEKVNVITGNPMLTRPASDAVKKWKFTPFTSDGKAVKALVPISLIFKL
jgi:protein TonB